jgi:hypothetical protein
MYFFKLLLMFVKLVSLIAYNFLCVHFSTTFSTGFDIIAKFCFFISFLIKKKCRSYWHFLTTMKPNEQKTAQKI